MKRRGAWSWVGPQLLVPPPPALGPARLPRYLPLLTPAPATLPCRRRGALPATCNAAPAPGPADKPAQQRDVAAKAVAAPPAPTSAPAKPSKTVRYAPLDGNEAVSRIAYAVNDVSFIYPITPATPMGEHVDVWAAQGRKNLFGNVMQVGAGPAAAAWEGRVCMWCRGRSDQPVCNIGCSARVA